MGKYVPVEHVWQKNANNTDQQSNNFHVPNGEQCGILQLSFVLNICLRVTSVCDHHGRIIGKQAHTRESSLSHYISHSKDFIFLEIWCFTLSDFLLIRVPSNAGFDLFIFIHLYSGRYALQFAPTCAKLMIVPRLRPSIQPCQTVQAVP